MRRLGRTMLWVGLFAGLVGGCASPAKRASDEQQAQTHRRLGEAYMRDGSVQKAYLELQKAVQFNPDDKAAHYFLGLVYDQHMGRVPEAIQAYQEAIQIDPNYSEAHNALGTVYGKLGQWDDAIQAFQKALKNPMYREPAPAHFNLGLAYYHLQRYDEAMAVFARAVRVDPAYLDPRFWRGRTLYETGKDLEAVSELGQVLRMNPRYPRAFQVHYYMGLAYLRLDRKAEAEKAFERTLKLAPRAESDMVKSAQRYLNLLRAP